MSVIARAEPENSILEIVEGFSAEQRGLTLAVLGNYQRSNPYHRRVQACAGAEVVFLGAIYDREIVQSLRFHSLAYVLGHRVGGTNPSLVEALGAGNAVIAHNNAYNRWVAGDAALYFRDASEFSNCVSTLTGSAEMQQSLSANARARHRAAFLWPEVLAQYEELLLRHQHRATR
jgi:glycosyltransferase involved in cell wall biosynthesis